jgi:hypothetical protein
MELERSLPHSKAPATCPNPESDQSSPYSPIPLTEQPFFNTVLPPTPET